MYVFQPKGRTAVRRRLRNPERFDDRWAYDASLTECHNYRSKESLLTDIILSKWHGALCRLAGLCTCPSAGQDAAYLPVVVLADGLRVACILPEQHLHKQQRRDALAHSPLHRRLCCAPLGRCPAAPLCRTFTWYPTLQGLFSCSHVQMRMRDHVTMHRLLNIIHYLWCFLDQTETEAQQQSRLVQEQLPRSAQAILPSSCPHPIPGKGAGAPAESASDAARAAAGAAACASALARRLSRLRTTPAAKRRTSGALRRERKLASASSCSNTRSTDSCPCTYMSRAWLCARQAWTAGVALRSCREGEET